MSPAARNLITRLLQNEPAKRPSINEILLDDFMKTGYMPNRLPTSCLTMAPRFDTRTEVNNNIRAETTRKCM